ncbi:MAG: aldehyde ferredoxin oxidoreductase family protein [Bacteroidia bacterium]|nr:aldehyde ferredoxin oxidoreductase family protein [Bacteroidia bacterium]
MGGHYGRLLRINLSNKTFKIEQIPAQILTDFIGGRGLGAKLLFDEAPAGVDPLGSDNKLYFVTGPLTGINAPTTSRFSVVTKSPLTGAIGGSSSGGHFGQDLKSAGFDVLAIEGKSDIPCFIRIKEDEVEICDASHIWGKNTHEATDILLSETDTKAGVACIGSAGENQLMLASIMNEKNHAAGRGGLGAVMGSKKLKAVIVSGGRKVGVNDNEMVQEALKKWRTFIAEAPLTKDVLKEYGTPALIKIINSYGAFPTKNFQEGVFIDVDSISGQTFKELYFVRREPCAGCPIGCARMTRTLSREGKGPEFETIWAFGALCGINDLESIIHANYNCNEYGMDTISTGNTIACAMELSEKNLFSKEIMHELKDVLGHELKFGDAEAIVKLTELIGKAQGFGKQLGSGSRRLAEKCHEPEAAMHVKGLELPAYDPRGFHGMALALSTNNRGGCHLRSYLISTEALATPVAINRFSEKGKPGITKLYQDLTATIDSMIACIFTSFALSPQLYADLVGAVMGLKMDSEVLLKTGERIWNIEKLFNLREGFSRKDDTLPQRILNNPLQYGLSKGHLFNLDTLLDEYYAVRGWTQQGVPTKEKLTELGLIEEAFCF